jgi:hypothetical protein
MRHINHGITAALGIAWILGTASSGQAATITKTDTPAGGIYLDASSATRTFSVLTTEIPANYFVSKVTFTIDFEKYDGETLGVNAGGNPYYNEIVLKLKNPAGVETSLIAAGAFANGSGGFRGVITFDDAATQFVNNNTAQLTAGTYMPTGAGTMSSLNTLSGAGNWTLTLQDTVAADHLGYWSSSMTLQTTFIPEPASLALTLLGAVPLLYRRRGV